MNNTRIISVVKVIKGVLVLTLFLSVGCGSKKDEEANDDKKYLDSLIKQSRMVEVKSIPVTSILQLTGKISMDENKSSRIFPLAGGIVVEVAVELGDYVKKGQLLATIRSPEIIDAQKDYKNNEAEVLNQEKNVEASKALFKSGLMSEKEYVLTQNQLQIAKNNLQKSKELLNIYHQAANPDEFNIFAPINGYIIEKNISPNMQFQGDQSESLFTVSDLNDVYVDANVYETDINKVHIDDSVHISTLAYPNKIFPGTISKIMNVLDPLTKTMKVRAKIQNNTYLKPEMFAQISINYQTGERMKAVPKNAVVFDNSLNYLLIKKNDSVEVKKIDIYTTNKYFSFFEGDLNVGDKVVTKDALLIYNALND
jgi:cobalt-zinc-cadmium efflux system membrane fusion protein